MKSPAEHQKLVKQSRNHDFYKRYIGNINIDNLNILNLTTKIAVLQVYLIQSINLKISKVFYLILLFTG